jgi:hypothetical protein
MPNVVGRLVFAYASHAFISQSRRNGPNILSNLALGYDGPLLSIDDNYVADFATGDRARGLCKVNGWGLQRRK